MPYCRKCGTQLATDALYCYKCGTPTTTPTQPPQPTATAPISRPASVQENASGKPVYKDTLFILILSTLIITIIALIIVATLVHWTLDINTQNLFESPRTNRVNLNIQELVNNSYMLH
ncbi:MAG: zinc ribbon domain-containing protein [Candidatus Bathyarchaeota archaeon]|nr:zinc ribbon domain-containing protein [Candidatus Termiticorpusculum sp.]